MSASKMSGATEFFNASLQNMTGILVVRGPQSENILWASSVRPADPSTLEVVGGFRVLFNASSAESKSASVDHLLDISSCPSMRDQHPLLGLMGKQDFGPVILCECCGVRDDHRLIFRPVQWAPASLVVAGSMGIVSLLNHRLTSADLSLLNSHPMDAFLEKLFNWYASSTAYLLQANRFPSMASTHSSAPQIAVPPSALNPGRLSLPVVDFLFQAMAFSSLTGEHFPSGTWKRIKPSPPKEDEEEASPWADGGAFPVLRTSWGVTAACMIVLNLHIWAHSLWTPAFLSHMCVEAADLFQYLSCFTDDARLTALLREAKSFVYQKDLNTASTPSFVDTHDLSPDIHALLTGRTGMNFIFRMILPLCRQQRLFLDQQLDIIRERFDFQTSWEAHPGHLPVTNMPIFDGRHSPVIDAKILERFPDDPISEFKGQNVIDVLRAVGLISDTLADTLLSGGYDPQWLQFGTITEPPLLSWVAISGSRLPASFEGKDFKDYHHLYYASAREDPRASVLALEEAQGLRRIPQTPALASSSIPAVVPRTLESIVRQGGDILRRHVNFARQRHVSSSAPSAGTSSLS